MKSLRSIFVARPFRAALATGRPEGLRYAPSKMTRQTIIRRVLLSVTVDAKPHVVIDHAFGDGLLRDVAVARRAVHLRADVRRVIELHVRFLRESVDALPRNLDALLRVRRHLLDQRTVGRNLAVADH